MANKPRPYKLKSPHDVNRLIYEVTGYLRTSIRDGTDYEGRRHALNALQFLTLHDIGTPIVESLKRHKATAKPQQLAARAADKKLLEKIKALDG